MLKASISWIFDILEIIEKHQTKLEKVLLHTFSYFGLKYHLPTPPLPRKQMHTTTMKGK